ncbi:hypothetical protein [Enterobacter asburiae]|uniref:hypothetical protein n=1 Tax=Enterobacter asburiae TaxID=61645 RepID=UPI000907BD58|nr:hypothetical protein [Enterobacter asburiae]
MSNIDKRALAITKELAVLMVERFSMNPVSSKLLNEAWQKEFPDEVAIAKRMLALLDELEAAEKRIAELEAREVKLPERYEVEICPTPSPDGDWYSREDVLAALATAGLKVAAAGKGE